MSTYYNECTHGLIPLSCPTCLGKRLADTEGELEKVKAERDAALKDAERYRWLRNNVRDASGAICDSLYVACDDVLYKGFWALDGQDLDVAIDAAREG